MAEKKIDGETYSCAPVLAKRAIVLQAKLLKVLGPGLEHVVKAFAGGGTDEQKAAAGVAALNAISSSLDPEAFGDLIEELVQLAEIQDNGRYRRVIFDNDFDASSLTSALAVVGFVIQTQFGDFFSALGGKGGARKALS